jgi:large subunit ribosomal protein L24
MSQIRKDDFVQVVAGREVSKTGKVVRVDAKSGRIYVEKLNMVKKHMRPTQKNPQGGVTEKEAGLHRSNVMLYCTKCKKGVRHRVKVAGTGASAKKSRVCAKCDSTVGVN